MTKQAVFTVKLDPELRAEFMAAAATSHRSASHVPRELMREYIAQQRAGQGYRDYLQQKGSSCPLFRRANCRRL